MKAELAIKPAGYRSTFISSPASDTVFLLGIPLIALGSVLLLLHFNLITVAAFVALTAIYTGAHHAPGFLRAYGTREIFETNRARLILAPLLIFSLILFLEFKGLRAYIVVLWFFNWWHTAMQNYGLLRIYERKALPAAPYSVKLDLISIIVWHFTASELLSDDMRFTLAQHLYNLNVGNAAFVSWSLWILRWTGIIASIVLLVLYIRNSIRQFRDNATIAINKQIFLAATYGLYFFMFYFLMNDISTSIESFYHNTQYVFFAWIMQRRLAERNAESGGSQFNWIGSVFTNRNKVIAALIYIAVVVGWGYAVGGSIKPRIQTATIVPIFNVFVTTFAFLHYYFDSFIWKARSREMSSVLSLKGAGMEMAPRSYRFSFVELSAWILVPIVIATLVTNRQNPSHNGVRENATLASFSADVLNDRRHWKRAAIASVDVGDFLSSGTDPEKSIQWYERAVSIRPDYADAYQALGHLYSREGDVQRAAAAYERAVALDSTFKGSLNNLGNVYAVMGDVKKARSAYERAIALDPRYLDAYLNLGNLQADLAEWAAAKANYERVLSLDPNSVDALRSLGVLEAQQNQFDDADKYFSRMIQVNPNDPEGYVFLGKTYLSRNRLDDAEKNLKLAIARNPKLAEPYLLLADAYRSHSEPAKAIEQLDSLIKASPDQPDAYVMKAQFLNTLGKPQDAVSAMEQAARIAPANAEIHGTLGAMYAKVGRLNEAEKKLQEAVRLDPNFADAYFELAQIYEKRGDRSVALMYLNQAARRGHPAAKQRLQTMTNDN